MNQHEVVSAFWQGMPAIWRRYRRNRTHNQMPVDIRVEFVDFVDMLHRDKHITNKVAHAVTLDSGKKTVRSYLV